jgi:hypothetical protein
MCCKRCVIDSGSLEVNCWQAPKAMRTYAAKFGTGSALGKGYHIALVDLQIGVRQVVYLVAESYRMTQDTHVN